MVVEHNCLLSWTLISRLVFYPTQVGLLVVYFFRMYTNRKAAQRLGGVEEAIELQVLKRLGV
jgi:hypothetical protein